MATCALAGTWMGYPTGSFYAMVMTMTQSGDTVTASIIGWYVPAQGNYDQVSYSLAGTVSGDTFSLAATSGSNPLTFIGTCSDANDISGTLNGEMYPGITSTAQISCVRLNTTYPNSITGQWQGTGSQPASLSLTQSGSTAAGVGSVSVNYQGQQVSFDVSASGSVSYPIVALTLNSTNARLGASLTFLALADADTIAGAIIGSGPVTLNRVVSAASSQDREDHAPEEHPSSS